MEKIQIICNPNAGRQILQKSLPKLINTLQNQKNIRVDINYTTKALDAKNMAIEGCHQEYDLIITVGGDGTVNEVVNGIMVSDRKPKLAIYPAGTVNDFGNYLKIPKSVENFSTMILKGNTTKVDVGLARERYFLNVAAAGLLPEVAHRVSSEAKTVLGKFAYYIEGIKEFSKLRFKPMKITLKHNGREEEKEILFFILANSPSVGGFKYVAPQAKINDGHLDLLIVENNQLMDVAGIFLKALMGNHTNHPGLQYIQVQEFTIHTEGIVDLDLDGELGGRLPANFSVKKHGIEVIIP
ncbi:diacylglycerol/lipid kinase family protein [Natronincola ferrireducens]|uniref:Diacylglycerol kinase n=1 Tax=Natronincola ferrireducens TaxID=393762 RepID=A0A1G9A348_9FIRM|nr:YegS/Rv2252/BmrU family lipid kinase [Natronincola ferrireducens]SDK21756.1 diacylglycerol kinase [Natronincola ferrireducens]